VGVPSINVIPPQLSFFYHIDTKNKGATIDTILYDNGTPSSGINFGLNSYYAVRFTPADPCSVIGCKIYLDDYYNNSIQIRIYDDNAGTPGTLIEIDTLTIGNSPQWYTFTFNSAYKDENDFWISVCGPTKLYYDAANSGRNKYSTNSGSTWNNFTTGDLLIRAIVNYYSNAGDSGEIWVKNIGTGMLNVNNITLKQSSTWITDLQPLNMNVNIGDSDAICVKIDTTGISTDIAYWDTVLISSNDPLHTLTNVPVKLLISTQSNIAPEITSIPDQCFLSGDSVKLQLDQYVADVEDPDAALVWNYTIVGDSVLVNIDADRVATIKTIVPWIGERSIIFRVTDTGGLSDEDTILVTVNPRSLTCIIYDTSGIFPDTIDIPIWLQGNPNGLGILSAYVSLNFNSTILTPIKVVKGEIVPGEWLIEDTLAAGEVKIGLSGATTSLSSAGKLAIVSFVVNAIAQNNDTTTIHFHGLQFNEGSIQVNSQDGIFTVKKGIYEISGEVTYYSNSIPVSGTDMILSSPTNTDTFTTPTNGNYAFVELERINYTVTSQKFNLQKESCIGAHDAALVFRHRLGIDTLNPDEQVAAEVSGNGIITAYDATLILKYSVGKIIHFDAGDWEFEPNNRVYAPLTSTKTDENYKAILYGDPSGNWGSKEEEIQPNMSIAMNDISCQVGDTVFLPMLIDMMPGNETDIVSCDLSIEFDSSVISVLGSTAGKLIPSEWLYESNILPGKIRIGLAGGKAIKEGGELLNLQIVAKSEAQVEAERKSRFGGAESQIRIAKAMLNETGIIVKNGKLSVKSKSPTEYKMAIRPVIANGKVTVLYQLPVSSEIRVDIYDIGGRLVNTLVHSKQGAGYYEIVWTPDNSGIYFCKFIANKFESIKKIVVVN
ncbi:MAG: T9SS type A sorting domain-containing protein, partial [Candidatus Stahlbacteria bacterium]|nr:T9SS type A sorting domain-containing protein [Candidatus Stahlbacteria bacterium]